MSVIARLGPFRRIENVVLIGATLIALGLGSLMLRHQDQIGCWEACQIATNVSTGHGFSFLAGQREAFDSQHVYQSKGEDALRYYPSAWTDPVYTYVLAAVISSSGSLYRYVAGWLNPLLFVAIVVLTFRLASRIEGVAAGLLSAILMTWVMCSHRWEWVIQLNNTVLSTVFVLLFAMALHRAVTTPSVKSAAVLGLATGSTILACPVAILFLPIALLGILLANWRRWRVAAISVTVTLCLAVTVMVPWAARNYLTFGAFIPVRTGSGSNSFIGVLATGATVEPATLKGAATPPWSAHDAHEAITTALQTEERRLLEEFMVSYALMVTGGEFGNMNEAQRDKWFQKETKGYLIEHPKLALDLAIWKMWVFVSIMGSLGSLLLALALLGGLVAVRRRRLDLLTFVMCIIMFAAPYVLIITYFPRYRLPIEPIVVIAAVITVWEFWRSLGYGSRIQEVSSPGRLQPITMGSESVRGGTDGLR
jgi:4-amino-4-deoxy-L-arabinose transferase-like glycosyltransferase